MVTVTIVDFQDTWAENERHKHGDPDSFIVDNTSDDWKLQYVREWCDPSEAIDIATGHFETARSSPSTAPGRKTVSGCSSAATSRTTAGVIAPRSTCRSKLSGRLATFSPVLKAC